MRKRRIIQYPFEEARIGGTFVDIDLACQPRVSTETVAAPTVGIGVDTGGVTRHAWTGTARIIGNGTIRAQPIDTTVTGPTVGIGRTPATIQAGVRCTRIKDLTLQSEK